MARTVEYPVILTEEEKAHLQKHTASGRWRVRAVRRAQILLKADTSENMALEDARNGAGIQCEWRFTTSDARIKLKKLYPTPVKNYFKNFC